MIKKIGICVREWKLLQMSHFPSAITVLTSRGVDVRKGKVLRCKNFLFKTGGDRSLLRRCAEKKTCALQNFYLRNL